MTQSDICRLCTILVVDDDEGIRESIRIICELEGYNVYTAENGRVALEVLGRLPNTPCIMLVDLMMPEMNGWSLVEALQRNQSFKQIPIVIVTAFPFEAKTVQAEQVITKPIDIDALLKVIRHWCGIPGPVEKVSEKSA